MNNQVRKIEVGGCGKPGCSPFNMNMEKRVAPSANKGNWYGKHGIA